MRGRGTQHVLVGIPADLGQEGPVQQRGRSAGLQVGQPPGEDHRPGPTWDR
jgi:hypothetical protein